MKVLTSTNIFGLFMAIIIMVGCVFTACSVDHSPNTNSTLKSVIDNGVEIVYFHRTNRCSGCIYAGNMVENTINTYFADELADGEIIFMTRDVQDDANAEIIDKYGAYTSSLYMNKVVNGVENIEEITGIWLLLYKDQEFTDYVKEDIEERLI
jgi:hypothetical protein